MGIFWPCSLGFSIRYYKPERYPLLLGSAGLVLIFGDDDVLVRHINWYKAYERSQKICYCANTFEDGCVYLGVGCNHKTTLHDILKLKKN